MLPPFSKSWYQSTEPSIWIFFPWRATSKSTLALLCDSLPLRMRCATRTRFPRRLRLRALPPSALLLATCFPLHSLRNRPPRQGRALRQACLLLSPHP
eukprot:2124318-Pleurochrysis_carterae.AAC.1